MVEDITDRKMAEASLKEAKEAAEAANRMKDQFLATVSHEIRTPLNAILGWTQILRMGVLKEAERCEALQKIEGSAKAQAQLIDDILDVSRIITGKLRFSREAVRLAPAVGAALDTVRRSAEEKGIEIEAKLDEELAVQGDPGRLQQVVWNLLSNAVKFTSPGGRIQVVLDRHEGRARLRVSDTGKGIHPQFLPKIFERFQQEDSSSTRLYAGLGLGLAIVSHLVEAHGGSIRAESEGPDRGATFTVSIPLLPAGDLPAVESSRPPPKPMRKERPLLDGVRILVVDDEANAREMLRSVLGSCGAEVESAASAAEALEKFRSFDPQVIVSDIAMPLQDGYSLIEKVRSLEQGRRKTAAIALTAYAGEQDRSRALSNGFDLHVAKPTDPLSVAGLVASLVRD
jgi:CheY-like chemotaxis protein